MRQNLFWLICLIVIGFVLYVANQTITIYGGDAGDLVAAALVGGVPHPPGYPLYTFINFLVLKIPLYTAAWRVSLVSSLSAIATLVLVFLIVLKITKNKLVSFIATLILAVNYLFWLYAIVPEVFSLNNLFIVLLIYIFLQFIDTKKVKYLYVWFLVFGLSTTHHHTTLFLLPPVIYFIYKNKKSLKTKYILKIILFFLVGLIPLLYLPIAASFSPPINWENPTNLTNFIRLVTRASYGTFKIGSYAADTILQRFYSFLSAVKIFINDFRILGIVLIVCGIFYTFKNNKTYFTFLGSLLLLSFVFILYASFPLNNDFLVATFERFLLFPTILMAFFIGPGILYLSNILNKLFKNNSITRKIPLTIIILMFMILPIGIFKLNYPKLSILKTDTTAENLALDILGSIEENSMLLISTDTPLFDTQYMYYWQKRWPDIKLIHVHKLIQTDYHNEIKKNYPDIIIPQTSNELFLKEFIEENGKKFPLYSKEEAEGLDGIWVPNGLVFRYYPDSKDVPSVSEIIQKNDNLWAGYQNPLKGSLGVYKNLMLSDVLRVYAVDRESYATYLLKNGKYPEAEREFKKTLELVPGFYDTHLSLGLAYYYQNKCDLALNEFFEVQNRNPKMIEPVILISKTYGECLKDKPREQEFKQRYESLLEEEQTSIKEL